MKNTLLIIPIIFIISSCGYKNVEECIVKEQQKGDGAKIGYVVRYCNDLFKDKGTKIFSNETKLRKDIDYIIKTEQGRIKVTNYSDQTINIVKIVGTECDGENTSIDWDKQINYLSGSSIYRGSTEDVIGLGEYKCFYSWVGYK